MSMTPSEQKTHTPRTDEAFQEYWNGGFWSLGFHSFAKILETDLAAMSAEVDTLRASIAEKDEALRASLEHQVMDSRNRTWDELRNMQRRALSSTGSELMERLKKAEGEASGLREQIHDLCHDKHVQGPVTPQEFCGGCEAFQLKIFGHSPIAELRASREKLGKALERSSHLDDCRTRTNADHECTCGLDAALAEWRLTIFPEPNTQTKTQ
jgi:hypothetical protein